MKQILFVCALLMTTLSALAQNAKEKTTIDTAAISYVELVKVNFEAPTTSLKKKLDKQQYAEFASKWNASTPLGADKYKMIYYVYLHLKNGKKRQFTIAGNKIQEQDWLTYDMKDKSYFDKLWNAAK